MQKTSDSPAEATANRPRPSRKQLGEALKRNMARRKALPTGPRSLDRASHAPADAAQSSGQGDRSAEPLE